MNKKHINLYSELDEASQEEINEMLIYEIVKIKDELEDADAHFAFLYKAFETLTKRKQ